MITTSAWHGALLFLTAVAVFPNCKTSHSPDTTVHSLVTVNTVLSVVAGICGHFLYDDDDKDDNTVEYAVNGGLILWMCLFANIFNLGTRMCASQATSEGNSSETTAGGVDNYATIKEDAASSSDKGENDPESANFNY